MNNRAETNDPIVRGARQGCRPDRTRPALWFSILVGVCLQGICSNPQPGMAAAPQYRWRNVTMKAAWAPRDGAGAVVFDNKMWLLGGWNPPDKQHFPKKTNNEVWSSTNGADWNLVKRNTYIDGVFNPAADWEGRHTAGYVVYQDRIWIVGGDPLQGHYQSDVWNSPDGKIWTHVSKDRPAPWGPRALHYTLVHDGKIWVMGGQTTPQFAPSDDVVYSDVWNTTDGIRWQQIETQGPCWSPRGMIGGSLVFRGRMWIVGGGVYDTPARPQRQFFNDVWSSADGVRWEQATAAAPWTPRQYHEVAAFDDRMWVLEGWNSGNRNDVWSSADGANWTQLPDTPWNPRHAASVFVYDNALWVVAGNNMEHDVWKLSRVTAESP